MYSKIIPKNRPLDGDRGKQDFLLCNAVKLPCNSVTLLISEAYEYLLKYLHYNIMIIQFSF